MHSLLRHLFAAAILGVSVLASANENPPGSAEASARLAETWLKLVDAGDYAQSWEQAGARFRQSVTAERWAAAMQQVRQPLGRVSAREFLDGQFTRELPRAPQGEYWVLRFKTTYEAVTAHEVVTLVREDDGHWHVVGFFIRPAS